MGMRGQMIISHFFSKQWALQQHDKRTCQMTAPGEKPHFSEYLMMVQVFIIPTTDQSQRNTLAVCSHIMQSYCTAYMVTHFLSFLLASGDVLGGSGNWIASQYLCGFLKKRQRVCAWVVFLDMSRMQLW